MSMNWNKEVARNQRQENSAVASGNIDKNVNQNAAYLKLHKVKPLIGSKSEETIYEPAVKEKRGSSSSEDVGLVDTSDEFERMSPDKQNVEFNDQIECLIIGGRKTAERNNLREQRSPSPQPSTSRAMGGQQNFQGHQGHRNVMTTDEYTNQMVHEAEAVKARIHATASNDILHLAKSQQSSVLMDEGYVIVGAHVDEVTVQRISRGEYVDFGKLILKDRIMLEEESCRMEMHVKNGKTFWSPVLELTNINSFAKWEQAFRVFANIYSKANPHRAAELIEYNHVIHVASMSFIWDNVYMYDKEFRLHMSRNTQHSWAIILQQAWSMRLKDRIHRSEIAFNNNNSNVQGFANQGNTNRARIPEPCRRFNRGWCNFGSNCKYEHKCSYCLKFGHGAVNCRRANADRAGKRNGDPLTLPAGKREDRKEK